MFKPLYVYFRLLATAILLCFACSVWALDTMTGIFNDRVHTLQVRGPDNDIFALPVIRIGSDDVLEISFDHISDTHEYLRWRAVRCEADWTPSTIAESEWLDGFNESRIERYDHSDATTVLYVHYSFDFPSPDLHPTLSGNYLVQVYPDDNPDDIWLQVRVMLSEHTANIATELSSQTDIDHNSRHQQLSVAVDTERAHVADPFNDLKVYVSQNGRLDSEVALRQPMRMSGHTAVYEHLRPLVFEAGNEYRRFETSNINYPGLGVDEISYHDPYYHFTLRTDRSRADQSYLYDQTQKGRFVVREYNSPTGDVSADYVVTHFTLDADVPAATRIFLDGDFVHRRFGPESEMIYNPSRGVYEKAILLKQGHYNYQYLAVPPGAKRGYTAPVEGDLYPTANEYVVKVYTRSPMERTDRLIGITRIIND